MTRRAGILAASFVLEHVPDLVRYGSKPAREARKLRDRARQAAHVRAGARLRAEPGLHRQPASGGVCGSRARPWWGEPDAAAPAAGPYGDIMDQRSFYELMKEVDLFDLVRLGEEPRPENGDLALYDGEEVVGAFARAHDEDEALSAPALLDNLACKAGGVHALRVHAGVARASTPSRSATPSAPAKRRSATATTAAAARSPRRSPRAAAW